MRSAETETFDCSLEERRNPSRSLSTVDKPRPPVLNSDRGGSGSPGFATRSCHASAFCWSPYLTVQTVQVVVSV